MNYLRTTAQKTLAILLRRLPPTSQLRICETAHRLELLQVLLEVLHILEAYGLVG